MKLSVSRDSLSGALQLVGRAVSTRGTLPSLGGILVIAGDGALTLRATDADWSHGTGPEVKGPILSLVMAMTGRKAADDDLAGDGVATLRSRP